MCLSRVGQLGSLGFCGLPQAAHLSGGWVHAALAGQLEIVQG
jgi:hypothetical protein